MIGSPKMPDRSLTVAALIRSRDREGAVKFLGFCTGAIMALLLGLGSCVPWTVRPIDAEKEAPEGPAAVSPAAYVDSIWAAKLVPAVLNAAVDARTLMDALAASPEDAQVRYGHREANGPMYFIVKGAGVVTSVDARSRNGLAFVDLAPFDRRADLSIQIGPVLRGTSLRDATGIVRFTDFVNQLQFADVGNELNDRVLKTVLASLDKAKLKGSVVTFAGTLAAEPLAGRQSAFPRGDPAAAYRVTGEDQAEPPLRELVPVTLVVEERRR